jgi:hypothetical protein
MIRRGVIAALLIAPLPAAAAGNAACWDDASRQDISCTEISPAVILSLQAANRATVESIMGVRGRPLAPDRLHFISNYSRGVKIGSGVINLVFSDDRVISIFGETDAPVLDRSGFQLTTQEIRFQWHDHGVTCSDFRIGLPLCPE